MLERVAESMNAISISKPMPAQSATTNISAPEPAGYARVHPPRRIRRDGRHERGADDDGRLNQRLDHGAKAGRLEYADYGQRPA
jgi:hypothetical protein